MELTQELQILLKSAINAGREEEAFAIQKTLEFWNEIKDSWIACLRCGQAFPDQAAHSRHYIREH